MSVARYTQSLVTLGKYGDSLEPDRLIDCLYGLIQEIPDLWKNPEYVGKGGNSVIVSAENGIDHERYAIKFALPIIADNTKRKGLFEWLDKKTTNKKDTKDEYEQRFKRQASLQEDFNKICIKQGLQSYGYIPGVLSKPRNNAMLHYAMEFIDGIPLLDWCKEHSFKQILEMFKRIMDFVNLCLHKNGCVHSDLKPDNILVMKTGLPVIIDFGIAKIITDDAQEVTHERSMLASDKFSSPQQKQFSKYRGRQDDIFTLGLTWWCMVNREIPQVPRGLKLGVDKKIHDLFSVSMIPSSIERFDDFFLKATNPDADMRFPNLDVAIENYQTTLNHWYEKTNTKVSKVVNQTTINNTYSKIDWKAAKEWAKDDKQKNCILDICLGLEWLFFKERE